MSKPQRDVAATAAERMPLYTYPEPRADRDAKDVLPLTFAGAPVLREPARAVRIEDIPSTDIQTLLARMIRTMRAAPGVGLAAPQVGVNLRIAVIEDRDDVAGGRRVDDGRDRQSLPVLALINPEIQRVAKVARPVFHEGCLSVPGYTAEVQRDLEVVVTGLDGYGKP
ncbi:MAG TPA: peptide deformylase, partial [Myxococcota bacterium]|nr:peptide deformylase [Myxococcota bacterium]